MSCRWAEAADVAALDAFLLRHVERAMFPLSNLRNYGISGQGGKHACRFHLTFEGPQLLGAVGVDQGGTLLPVGAPDFRSLRGVLAETGVTALLGEAALVEAALSDLALEQVTAYLVDIEPHFTLALSGLRMPDTGGLSLVPLAAMPRHQAIGWRAAYAEEVLGDEPGAAAARAVTDIDGFVAENTHRALYHGETPVAICGFNAVLPEVVQVGAVFTPPELRGRGYARAAVALHLAEARAGGVSSAVLFAASEPAARAYRALGFKRIGSYGMVLWSTPCPVGRATREEISCR